MSYVVKQKIGKNIYAFEECRQKLKEWVTFYNNERIHSAIGYRTPKECYEEYMKNSLKLLTH